DTPLLAYNPFLTSRSCSFSHKDYTRPASFFRNAVVLGHNKCPACCDHAIDGFLRVWGLMRMSLSYAYRTIVSKPRRNLHFPTPLQRSDPLTASLNEAGRQMALPK